MSNLILRTACAALLLATGGCALFAGGGPQQVEVHALLDGREVAGVGCMLANDSGRWFVLAPGRVTVQRSRGPLAVDCLREGSGSDEEQLEARRERALLKAHQLLPAGGFYGDGRLGAGYSYPATINIDLHAPAAASPLPAAGNAVF
jgi:hypothetical protein